MLSWSERRCGEERRTWIWETCDWQAFHSRLKLVLSCMFCQSQQYDNRIANGVDITSLWPPFASSCLWLTS